MTSTTPPMDHGTPSTSPITDERGLERLFRAHFTPLVEQARGELDTAAQAAPRVVEGAFKHAWEERARFQTPAELEAFLHDSVHHGAARELSRRASVHHFHSTAAPAKKVVDAPPNVDESWTRVSHSLHVGEDTAEKNAEVSQHLRHDAAEHVAAMAKKTSYKLPITITIVGAALALGGLWWVKQAGADRSIMRALNDGSARTSVAPGGQMAIVNLDDAIKATSSPETRLTVPKNYGPNLRAVKLEGGPARFEVQPGQTQPFQVRVFSTAILVTGTDFTVRAVASDSTALVYVREGQVSVRAGDSARTVAKGSGIAVAGGKFRDVTPGETEELTTWSDGNLTISGRQLRAVLPELKRWYGLDIKVPDLPLLDRTVTIHAPLDSPQAAITEVEKSAGLKFGYEGKTMVFRDGAKKK
jgi:ferric-dicitrate binding protein FerR (iron transport regulator)